MTFVTFFRPKLSAGGGGELGAQLGTGVPGRNNALAAPQTAQYSIDGTLGGHERLELLLNLAY